jgi:hypothetical protein
MPRSAFGVLVFSLGVGLPLAVSAPAPFLPRRVQERVVKMTWSEAFKLLAEESHKPVIYSWKPTGYFPHILPKGVKYDAAQLANVIDQALRTKRCRLIERGRNFIVVGTD